MTCVERLVGDHQHRLERRAAARPPPPPACRRSVTVVALLGVLVGVCRLGGVRLGRGARRTRRCRSRRPRRSAPVQRTVSSPSGVTWSKADRPLAEQLEQRQEPRHRGQRVRRVAAQRPEGHRAAAGAAARPPARACSRTLTRAAWMCCSDDLEHRLGLQRPGRQRRRTARARCRSAPRAAGWRTAPPARPRAGGAATRRPAASSSTPATCLNALYCSSRAKSRSRASSSARSSSSSTSPCGSSRAALRSSRVEATSRNDVVCSRSQTVPPALTWAMNSSVTRTARPR